MHVSSRYWLQSAHLRQEACHSRSGATRRMNWSRICEPHPTQVGDRLRSETEKWILSSFIAPELQNATNVNMRTCIVSPILYWVIILPMVQAIEYRPSYGDHIKRIWNCSAKHFEILHFRSVLICYSTPIIKSAPIQGSTPNFTTSHRYRCLHPTDQFYFFILPQ